MLLVFVDESYDSDSYYMGAAIAPIEAWERVEQRLETVRAATARQHGTSPSIEFHGHELMGGRGDWSPLRGKHREAAGVYRAALRAARDEGVRYVFRGLDVARLNARYRYPDQPHAIVFGHLLERIDEYARVTLQAEQVIVVADQIATQEEHRRQFDGYQRVGTPGYRPSLLGTISSPLCFSDSRNVDGLQIADLAVYLHRRRETTVEVHPAAAAARRRLVAELSPGTFHAQTWVP